MLYSEYFTSHFYKPVIKIEAFFVNCLLIKVRSIVRIAEDGEFFNIITSNIFGAITYLIPTFFIGLVYLITHALLHNFGVALAALGCVTCYFTLNAIFDVGGQAKVTNLDFSNISILFIKGSLQDSYFIETKLVSKWKRQLLLFVFRVQKLSGFGKSYLSYCPHFNRILNFRNLCW